MKTKPNLYKIIIYILISIVLFIIFILSWISIEIKWQLFFFLTFWSFWLNEFYLTTLTICDILTYFSKSTLISIVLEKYLRNDFLRIIFPFSFTIVILFWLLVLLGDEFQSVSGINDLLIDILLHGIIFIFIIIDMFLYTHVYQPKIFLDIIIITAIYIFYIIILGIGKYAINFDTYDFMLYCRPNHLVAVCIMIYLVVLDGYAIYHLIGYYCFDKNDDENEEKKNDKNNNEEEDVNNINNILND